LAGLFEKELTRHPWGEYYERRARRFEDPLVASEYITPEGRVDDELVEQMADYIIRELALGPEDHFLEIGCACGVIMNSLFRRGVLGAVVQGIDVAPTMIEKARKMIPGASFEVLDAASVEKLRRRFDKILLWGVVHYLNGFDYVDKVLDALLRTLKPSGAALVGWIPDAAMKDDYVAWRRGLSSVDNRLRIPRPASLQWLWFEKEYFKSLEKRSGIQVDILDHQAIPTVLNRFFFSVRIKNRA